MPDHGAGRGIIDCDGGAVIVSYPRTRHRTGIAQQGRILEREFRSHDEDSQNEWSESIRDRRKTA
jgi:hypothetical protein